MATPKMYGPFRLIDNYTLGNTETKDSLALTGVRGARQVIFVFTQPSAAVNATITTITPQQSEVGGASASNWQGGVHAQNVGQVSAVTWAKTSGHWVSMISLGGANGAPCALPCNKARVEVIAPAGGIDNLTVDAYVISEQPHVISITAN